MIQSSLTQQAQELSPWLVSVRRELHMHPELGGQEQKTQAFVLKILQEMGIETLTYPGQYAVVGLIRGSFPGKTIAIRADMDALPIQEENKCDFISQTPGVMHACGHDAHMAIVLGAARLLSERRDKLHGNVKLFFEPAEETVGGAREMVATGCMENPHVDAVLGLHMLPDQKAGVVYTKPGCVSGASDDINITVHGKSCHGAYPERGTDALLIASQIVVALQTLVSRNVSPLDSAVVSLCKIQGGSARNIICNQVEIEGTLRTLLPEVQESCKRRIVEVAQSLAEGLGGSADVTLRDSYGAVYNNEALYERFAAVAKDIIGEEQMVLRPAPSLGVESFGFFVKHAPGMYYDLGCGIGTPLHTSTFTVDEACLPVGVALQTAMALDYLKG